MIRRRTRIAVSQRIKTESTHLIKTRRDIPLLIRATKRSTAHPRRISTVHLAKINIVMRKTRIATDMIKTDVCLYNLPNMVILIYFLFASHVSYRSSITRNIAAKHRDDKEKKEKDKDKEEVKVKEEIKEEPVMKMNHISSIGSHHNKQIKLHIKEVTYSIF